MDGKEQVLSDVGGEHRVFGHELLQQADDARRPERQLVARELCRLTVLDAIALRMALSSRQVLDQGG